MCSNNIITLKYELMHESNVSCHDKKLKHYLELEDVKAKNVKLEESKYELENDLKTVKDLLKETKKEFTDLNDNYQKLTQDFAVQESTLSQLLNEERMRNQFFFEEKARCNAIETEHEHFMIRFHGNIHYLSQYACSLFLVKLSSIFFQTTKINPKTHFYRNDG